MILRNDLLNNTFDIFHTASVPPAYARPCKIPMQMEALKYK